MWMRILTPGRSASGKRSKSDSLGMTLIELLVAMAIVGMIMAVAATGLRSVFDVNLKSAASRLASTLRYLSNKAVTDHLYLRMVYNLEDETYQVEESSDPFVISPAEEEEEARKEEKKEGEEEETEAEAEEGEKTAFTQSEAKFIQPTKLPSDVFFKDVSVSYLPQKREGGLVRTYFFPDGFATATVINLRDEDDEDHYSVELFPLSGRVRVAGEYREALTEEKR